MTVIVEEWRSRSGRWWVKLERFDGGRFGYQANHAGGVLASKSEAEAVDEVQDLVDKGLFQPDSNKTPMIRVGKEHA